MEALGAIELRAPSDTFRGHATPRAHGGWRIATLVRVLFIGWLIAQTGRIPLMSAGEKDAPVLINDLLLLGVLAAAAAVALRERILKVDRTAAFSLAFAAVGASSALLAIPRFGLSPLAVTFSLAYLLRWLVYFGLYLVVINFIRYDDVGRIWGTLEKAGLIFAGFGIFQSIFLPGFAQIVYPSSARYQDWDPQGHRLVSTFLDPNFAGAAIVLLLLVLAGRLAFGEMVPRWKLLLLFTALVLTLSRSSILGLLAGGSVILFARGKSRRLLKFIALLAILLLPLLPPLLVFAASYNKLSIDESALLRLLTWARAIDVLGRYPVIGVGFNTYGFVQAALYGGDIYGMSAFGLDGGLLFIGVMTGVVGVVLYSCMAGSAIARARGAWRDPGLPVQDRGLCLGMAAGTTALFVHSIFLNSLLYPFLMEVQWVLWGLCAVIAGHSDPRPRLSSEDIPPHACR